MPTDISGKEIHEFVQEEVASSTHGPYIQVLCEICGGPEKTRLHFHEFKLVFGGYTCQICAQTIDAECHHGVNVEGITERPIRETVETVPDDKFWVNETEEQLRKSIHETWTKNFARNLRNPPPVIETRYFDGTIVGKPIEGADEVDDLVSASRYNPEVDLNSSEKAHLEVINPPLITTWSIVGFCALGVGIIGNSALSLYTIFM